MFSNIFFPVLFSQWDHDGFAKAVMVPGGWIPNDPITKLPFSVFVVSLDELLEHLVEIIMSLGVFCDPVFLLHQWLNIQYTSFFLHLLRNLINMLQKRQPRRAKSASSCPWVGSTFWKTKPRCVNKPVHWGAQALDYHFTASHFLSPPVFVVHLPFVHCLLLRPPAILNQSLWLRSQTPCSRHLPLLSVPEQEVCKYSQHSITLCIFCKSHLMIYLSFTVGGQGCC